MTSCKITIFSIEMHLHSRSRVVIFHRHVTFRGSILDFVNWDRPADWKKKHHPNYDQQNTNKNPLVATSLADQSWVDGWWDPFLRIHRFFRGQSSATIGSPLSSRFCGWKTMAKDMKPCGCKPCSPDPLLPFVINLWEQMGPGCVISKYSIYIKSYIYTMQSMLKSTWNVIFSHT